MSIGFGWGGALWVGVLWAGLGWVGGWVCWDWMWSGAGISIQQRNLTNRLKYIDIEVIINFR